MKQWFVKTKEQGFTLVELMVVVAIIGVLSALAIPNFKKYQAKSKTSEAKLQLAAAYTGEQSFYSDYDSYHVCLKYMGFNPANEVTSRYYAVGFGSDLTSCTACDAVATVNGALAAVGGCTGGAGESWWSAGRKIGSTAAISTFAKADIGAGGTAISEDNFTIGAVGIIDDGSSYNVVTTASAFQINENKLIMNNRAGY